MCCTSGNKCSIIDSFESRVEECVCRGGRYESASHNLRHAWHGMWEGWTGHGKSERTSSVTQSERGKMERDLVWGRNTLNVAKNSVTRPNLKNVEPDARQSDKLHFAIYERILAQKNCEHLCHRGECKTSLTSSLQTLIEINSFDQLVTKTYPRLRRINR